MDKIENEPSSDKKLKKKKHLVKVLVNIEKKLSFSFKAATGVATLGLRSCQQVSGDHCARTLAQLQLFRECDKLI